MSSPTQPAGTSAPLMGIRRIAARRMVQAWEAPVFHLAVTVDMTGALTIGSRIPGATVTDALIRACAGALLEVPDLNAHYSDEVITTFDVANIAIAVATDAGLTVPVVHDAHTLDLAAIGARRKDVVQRARAGKLSMADYDGATFTVSNLGMLGVDYFDAILNPPQVGILAVGATKQTPVAVDGTVQVRPLATFTLTCDHRAVDGAAGARLLAALRTRLESAEA